MKLKPEQLQPLGKRILARRYKKPEKIGSLWLNPVWRTDNSRAIWEPVAFSRSAAKDLRETLDSMGFGRLALTECLLVTPPHRGVGVEAVDMQDEDGEQTLAYFIDGDDVIQVVPWT